MEKQLIGEHLEEILDKGIHLILFISSDQPVYILVYSSSDWLALFIVNISRQCHRILDGCVVCVCVCVCVCAGYESLLEAVRVSELSLLYGFFARFKDGLPLMSRAFSDYIKVHIHSHCPIVHSFTHTHTISHWSIVHSFTTATVSHTHTH